MQEMEREGDKPALDRCELGRERKQFEGLWETIHLEQSMSLSGLTGRHYSVGSQESTLSEAPWQEDHSPSLSQGLRAAVPSDVCIPVSSVTWCSYVSFSSRETLIFRGWEKLVSRRPYFQASAGSHWQ